MSETRIEKDLLGSREIPADAYWGVHTLRAKENFPISGQLVGDHPTFVKGMAQVKKAEALANRQAKAISQETADAIVAACDLVLTGEYDDQFPIDMFQGGAGTSVNMNANEVIANLALEQMGLEKGRYDVVNPNDHVNKSQSTNDAYPTSLHLAIYYITEDLTQELEKLADAFDAKAKEFAGMVKMGRTQLQDAVPMSVGQEFAAFAQIIRNELVLMRGAASMLLTVNLGGTAIGNALNTPDNHHTYLMAALSEVTGLDIKGAEDLIAATSDTSDFITVHSAMKRVSTKISKICNDLRLLSSGPRAGLNEINLPEMQAGSSIMPAKVNPVIPEVVNQVCFKVIGNDLTVTLASEAAQLQLNVMEPVIAQCVFESGDLLTAASEVLRTKCVDGITVNEDICRRNVEESIGLITYLNDVIGHEIGDEIGKECARTGATVREAVLARDLLTEEQLDEILSVDNLLNPAYLGERFE